ncbi:MAG: acetyl-CoA carboxylase biotin carboxyl carrier protein [Ktedonobacteraceae bacterium]
MDGNWHNPYDTGSNANDEHEPHENISVEQLRRLVQLLDHSDVSEIELKRAKEGTRLLLRKAKAPESTDMHLQPMMLPITTAPTSTEVTPIVETTHHVVATLVGIFHSWAKPKGGTLVAIGDKVKAGQLVGTIQSLNVINEVETPKAGRVVDILVQEGQAVEYGQHLMTIDSTEGA